MLELISAHKKSCVLQDTSSKVCPPTAKPVAVKDDLSGKVGKKYICAVSSIPHTTHETAVAASQSPVVNSSAECARDSRRNKIPRNLEAVATGLTDGGENVVMRRRVCTASDNTSNVLTATQMFLPLQSKEISQTSRQKISATVSDMSSLLAADMVNLYRNKVLSKDDLCTLASSSTAVSVPTANSRVDNVADVQMSSVGAIRGKRTNVTLVNKSPFKLVKTVPVQPRSCRSESVLLPDSKSLQAVARSGSSATNIPGKTTNFSNTPTSSYDVNVVPKSVPCSTSANATCIASGLTSAPSNVSLQLGLSTKSSTIPSRDGCETVSSLLGEFVHAKHACPNVNFFSSKYKLVRRKESKESACKSTSRQAPAACWKDSSATPCGPHRVAKHTPTLLFVNKYKLVRKKRRSLTLSAKKTPSATKKTASWKKSSHDVLMPFDRKASVCSSKTRLSRYKLVRNSDHPQPYLISARKPVKQSTSIPTAPFCSSSLASDQKMRSSRYKFVRKNDPLHSTPVKKLVMQSSSNQAGDKVQVLSKYKLVRRKSTATLRTPQHAVSAPSCSQCVTRHGRSHNNKHMMPPLFLNKYKLIRKRVLLKTNSSCHRNLTARSSSVMQYSKPSAEEYKHEYSRKQHTSARRSSHYRLTPKNHGTRSRGFMSKYALLRSGRGRSFFYTRNCTVSCFK